MRSKPLLFALFLAFLYALKGWHKDEATAQAQTATKRWEVLWMNFEPAGQQKLF